MFIGRIGRKVCKLSKMIARLDKFVVLSPVVYDKSNVVQNPCSVSLNVRYLRSSRLVFKPKSSLESIQSSSSGLASRISRAAKTEAQLVLFDYLHSTRSIDFMDAEHISKNSTHLLQNLLSKIDPEKDVVKSLSKFLRLNPINEFEPFFESLSLSPLEMASLVPQGLMFLRDDGVILDNFHAYENLGLSKPIVIKLVSCCPSLLVGGVDAEFAGVLERFEAVGMKNDEIGGFLSEDIALIVSTHVELMGSCSLKGPKTVMPNYKDELCQIIKEDLLKWFSVASKSEVQSSGRDEMLKALKLFRGRGDQLQERFDCLVNADLDCNVVKNLIKHALMLLNQ
ncbi:hypothetical protein CRYUN_Cryun31cG0058900 [Craigia yunnanensis]